jgi:TRL-like protein family
MRKVKFLLLALAMILLVSGCSVGLIYTHTWQPLTLDTHTTRITPTSGQGDIKQLVLLYPPLSAAWGDASIGDIAKKKGLNELYFADLEYFSILHIWNQYTVHVYGK